MHVKQQRSLIEDVKIEDVLEKQDPWIIMTRKWGACIGWWHKKVCLEPSFLSYLKFKQNIKVELIRNLHLWWVITLLVSEKIEWSDFGYIVKTQKKEVKNKDSEQKC